MNIQNTPKELKRYRQYVAWRYEQRKEKLTKVPYSPRTGQLASSTDPDTWGDIDDALSAMATGNYDGIGFVFTKGAGITGVDLDHCLKNGKLTPFAENVLKTFNSYAEISPSGTGLHILVRGQINGKGIHQPHIEIYDQGRYFTLTGDVFRNYHTLREGGELLDRLCAGLRTRQGQPVKIAGPVHGDYEPPDLKTLEALFNKFVSQCPQLRRHFNRRRGNPSQGDYAFACGLIRQFNFRPLDPQHIAILRALLFLYRAFQDKKETAVLDHGVVDPSRLSKKVRLDYLSRTIAAAFGEYQITKAG